MNTIVLLLERDSVWSPEEWAEKVGGQRVNGVQIMIERAEDCWLSIVRNDEVLDDFDEVERARLDELVSEPVAYLVEWNGGDLVELMLRSVLPGTRAAIDNDHGLLASVHQVAGEPLESWVKAKSLP